MTTSHSPLRVLKAQAGYVAKSLKAATRGESDLDPEGRVGESLLIEALKQDSITLGIAMDDKLIEIEISWDLIRKTSEVALAEFILREMRGRRETVQ